MYLEHYDKVLDLCKHTADAPAALKAGTRRDSLAAAQTRRPRPERGVFASGQRGSQIEITASYLHFTDMIDPDALRAAWPGW